ncbi:IS66 family transposase [Rhizobium multihospitium]|uniref:Transposase IS66 family protein n=1 Tax=Rhizobium multihospitium TaxID=410764 RepID=A0A1C3XC20_9HYPH|nr:transposase [Rhizobium multihospitium]SCB49695.1 Transposase IS66 family protein [Rhizobium multihospitium]
MKKSLPSVEHVETLSLVAMRRLVGGLVEELHTMKAEVATLRLENAALREDNAQLHLDNDRLKIENQQLRDEIARLKKLPPRPPFRPSGMDKATEPGSGGRATGKSPRGPKRDKNRITRIVTLRAEAPEGSRFKGYKSFFVRDLVLIAELVHYRRERWRTPEGKMITAPLPDGVANGFGRNLRRLCLALSAQGQVTTPRLAAILGDVGVEISKRQIIRLLTTDLKPFVAEDSAVLHAGLVSAPFVTVDDTGARHNRRNAFTTQIGGDRFTVFRTSLSKSRLNFLSILRSGHQGYVINDEAMSWLKTQGADHAIIAKLETHAPVVFVDQVAFLEHLAGKEIDIFDRQLVRLLAEATIWGAIRHHGLLGKTTIVSDDAGQFRVGNHALCWIHAERLLQKLMPAKPKEVRSVTLIRDLVWRFYKALKFWKQQPSPHAAQGFQRRFDRIFTLRTGYNELDRLLVRLHRRKRELLKVLEHPDIPLHTNASENDLRSFVTRRKISGGTISLDGRIARDTMLGLMKTCQKLGISFYHYLGDRLGLETSASKIPSLTELVGAPA